MSTTNPERTRHVGVDVSKARLDVCLLAGGESSGETLAVTNDPLVRL